MKKILTVLALGMIGAMSWAAVNITVNPNVIDFGTVKLNADGEAEAETTATLTWSGLIDYCSVFVDTVGVMPDLCEFYATSAGGYDYWYGGDMYNPADDPTVYVGFYAIEAGEYSIKYSFYSFVDEDWMIKSQGAELTVKVKVVNQTTGLEDVASKVESKKILRDGQILIIRNGETYSITGVRVQ